MRKSSYLGVFLGLVACSELAGLGEERGLVKADASSTVGGNAGSGAVAGQSGSGGTGAGDSGLPDSSLGGASGSGASAGTAGAGGTAGGGGVGAIGGASGSGGTGGDAGSCDAGASDPLNCGSCGHDCLGGACVKGECQPFELTSTPQGAQALAVGDGMIYWGNIDFSNHYRMPVNSTAPSSWYVSLSGPADAYAAGGYFFIAARYGKSVLRQSTTLQEAPQTFWSATDQVKAVTGDASTVYYTQLSSIEKTDGNSSTTVATLSVEPRRLASDATHIYFTNTSDGVVARVPKTGGTAQSLHSPGSKAWALTVDSQYVYFSNWTPDVVYRASKDGTGTPEALASGMPGVFDMVRAGPYLYFTSQGTIGPEFADGRVWRVRLDGPTPGSPELVKDQLGRPQRIATDGIAVYFLLFGSGINGPGNPGGVWKQAL